MPIATPLSVPTLAANGVNGDSKKATNGSGYVMPSSESTQPRDAVKEPEQPKYTSTSYPSNCLRFLQNVPHLRTEPESFNDAKSYEAEGPGKPAKVKLDVLIVGAGLGGLATAIALRRRGHDVTVFEQAPELMEVGVFFVLFFCSASQIHKTHFTQK